MTMIRGDSLEILPTLDDRRFAALVTSPPYLRQRIYGDDPRELGLEDTLADYVTAIADVFDAARPKLRPDGHAWLNIGDKANGSGGAGGDWSEARLARRKAARIGRGQTSGPGAFLDPAYGEASYLDVPGAVVAELLRRGWRLRLAIVWDKGRDAPESLRHVRRPRMRHEMIYLLSPTPKAKRKTEPRSRFFPSLLAETGSVWHFTPGANRASDPHLAPFPDELARRCILPSTLPGDEVLDPFAGSGTVPRVAHELGRHGLGIDLYAAIPEEAVS